MAFAQNKFKFDSLMESAIKDIEKGKRKQRLKAVSHFKRALRKTIKSRNLVKKGNLLKGVSSDNYSNASLVGMSAPAYHALIVEYGSTGERVGKRSGKSSGVMPANPYFTDTMRAEMPAMQKIMTEEWVG